MLSLQRFALDHKPHVCTLSMVPGFAPGRR
jgi:hypothetical protein